MTDPLPPALLSPGSDVEEWLGEVATTEPDTLPERVQAWRIDGIGSAAWAMAHVAQAEAALSDLTAQATEWYGKVSTTAKGAKVVVTDGPAVIAWAKVHAPEAVKTETVETLRLGPLRARVGARKVWTLAWVTNSCGCKVSVRDDEGLDLPEVGALVESCSECEAEALIGKIEPLAYRWLATTEDGAHVPGVDVQPEEVTAKVVLG